MTSVAANRAARSSADAVGLARTHSAGWSPRGRPGAYHTPGTSRQRGEYRS